MEASQHTRESRDPPKSLTAKGRHVHDVDERDHHFARRSSSAWAKYAEAPSSGSRSRGVARSSRVRAASAAGAHRCQARPLAGIALRLAHPATKRPRRCTRVSRRPTGSRPIAIRVPPHAPAPGGRRVHVVPGSTSRVVPCGHILSARRSAEIGTSSASRLRSP
jgi:hypothetical protein